MRRIISILVAFCALTVACQSKPAELPVHVEYPKNVDFSVLETFRPAVATAPEASAYPRYQEMARTAVAEEMGVRGFTRLEDGTPDFRVRAFLRFKNYATRTLGTSATTGGPDVAEGDIRDATLVVEILSPTQEKVIWKGTVSGFQLDPFKPRKTIQEAAWRLLVEFPPLW